MSLCPCSSGKEYEVCCKQFHSGKIPETALELMRSRYSAYALDIPEYIIETTHPASNQYKENKFSWKRGISKFSKCSIFKKLEILDFKENGPTAMVTFTAHIEQEGQDASFTEKSYFEKLNGRWYYLLGYMSPEIMEKPLRLLPLAYYGNPILRKKAEPVSEISAEIKKLVEDMVETMDITYGVGLAAPQVKHSLRLFVIRTPIKQEDGKYELGDVKVFINPKITSPSAETETDEEACLSIPSVYGMVERPIEITVEYTNLDGKLINQKFFGYEARVIMHENDHINGVLFIDRVKDRLQKSLQAIEKRLGQLS